MGVGDHKFQLVDQLDFVAVGQEDLEVGQEEGQVEDQEKGQEDDQVEDQGEDQEEDQKEG